MLKEKLVNAGQKVDKDGNIITVDSEYVRSEIGFNLGSDQTDDRDGCVTTTSGTLSDSNQVVNRRVGTCNDGIYTVKVKQSDIAGNQGDWYGDKQIERDTVAPNTPTLTTTNTGDQSKWLNYLGLKIQGEGRSLAKTNITYDDVNLYREYDLGETGVYETTNLLGLLQCGGKEYNVKTKLVDRAGNETGEVSSSITTGECEPPPPPVVYTDSYTGDTYTYGGSEYAVSTTASYLSAVVEGIKQAALDHIAQGKMCAALVQERL